MGYYLLWLTRSILEIIPVLPIPTPINLSYLLFEDAWVHHKYVVGWHLWQRIAVREGMKMSFLEPLYFEKEKKRYISIK